MGEKSFDVVLGQRGGESKANARSFNSKTEPWEEFTLSGGPVTISHNTKGEGRGGNDGCREPG